ncbi:MAG: hypothetical protein LBH12_06400 [Dysgonamonadaceae bacterium]|jgi:hypothetical protein|nr:hypothetical protein [Dysgonamonadaceae bacterium]
MMKFLFSGLLLFSLMSLSAQNRMDEVNFKFSGFIRGDLVYNTRESVTALEDLFYLYPKDRLYDEAGKDLNAQMSSGFYTIATRVALDVSGIKYGNSEVSGKIEADFAAAGGTAAMLRLRLAYLKMDWSKASLWIGQNWHPLFQTIQPDQLTLATGAPFQPFNRSPQIRYDYRINSFTLKAAAVYQLQNKSTGPEGKSNIYQKNAVLPELNGIIEYKKTSICTGIGIIFLPLKPRRQSFVENKRYKVDERVRSLSYTAYFQYTEGLFKWGLKSMYGQNNSGLNMLGGYGIKASDSVTGERKYTNFNYSASWMNVSYGNKYKANLMLGYTKNLGTDDNLLENSELYGEGLDVDNMYRIGAAFSYNIPHLSSGLEYEFISANYGNKDSFDWNKGQYNSTHEIKDHRITVVIRYIF